MGIQAPGPQGTQASILTALISYNRPIILIFVFIITFLTIYFLAKKNSKVALAASIIVTLILALFFILTYTSGIRY